MTYPQISTFIRSLMLVYLSKSFQYSPLKLGPLSEVGQLWIDTLGSLLEGLRFLSFYHQFSFDILIPKIYFWS